MSTATDPNTNLHPRIDELLGRTRQAIRRYVCAEGVALALASWGLLFWIGMALDYLPVKLGSSEMPVRARAVLLLIILAVVLFVVYRWVVQRYFVRMSDSSLALLIERRFPQFHDSLVTTVEASVNGQRTDEDTNLLAAAGEQAVGMLDDIDVDKLFDYRALMRALIFASALVFSLLWFAAAAGPTFRTGISRLFGLSATPYPRSTLIELVGFHADRQLTLARGDDLKVRVRADANRPTPVPTVCTIYYKTGDGERGRVNMSRVGKPRDGYQQYAYNGSPFTNILSDVTFDVVGNDHRLHDCRVHIVDSPQIAGIQLAYELPAYTGLLPRNDTYRPGIQLAYGSRATLTVLTNKTLRRAEITDVESGDMLVLAADEADVAATASRPAAAGQVEVRIVPELAQQTSFSYTVQQLTGKLSQEITLFDTDGTTSRRPYNVSIAVAPDQPPQVDARLSGIGSAITPIARLPIEGEIVDDFGVDQSWIAVELEASNDRNFPIVLDANGRVDTELDLRKQRTEVSSPLELPVDTKVTISVHAQDRFDLADAANVGDGDRYELDVVTASQLMALLEAREVGLRVRFKQIISDFRETRDSLSRVEFKAAADEDTDDPAETETIAARARGLRLLRIQRAAQHSQRAAQEVIGVALSFDDVRQELINNRVDSEDRQRRLEFDISKPLMNIGEQLFPDLDRRIADLQDHVDDMDMGPTYVKATVRFADDLLVAMERVLQKMLDLESYNELVDMVRSLIRDQDVLIEETKQQQKNRALDLLK